MRWLLPLSLAFTLACAGLDGEMARSRFVAATLALEDTPPSPARDTIARACDDGWLAADTVGYRAAADFQAEVLRVVADKAISADELATLSALSAPFPPSPEPGREAALAPKRKAEAAGRKPRAVALADWLGPGALQARGEALGWITDQCSSTEARASCTFHQGEELVNVTLRRFESAEAARADEMAGPMSATYQGPVRIEVTATDGPASGALALALLSPEVRAGVAEVPLRAGLSKAGFHVSAYNAALSSLTPQVNCDFSEGTRRGSATLLASPVAVGPEPVLDFTLRHAQGRVQAASGEGAIEVLVQLFTRDRAEQRLRELTG